jgi:hypothetical protein
VSATQRLADLDAQAEAANERYREALRAVERQDPFQAGVDALSEVIDYHRDVEARRREADTEELHRLTAEACERIKERGLVFVVPAAGTIRLTDPSYDEALDTALAEWNRAKADRDVFAMESHLERKAEADREMMDRVRAALDGNDPDALREALNPSGDGPLTTADLEASHA